MKTVVTAALSFALAFAVAACEKEGSPPEPAAPQQTPPLAPSGPDSPPPPPGPTGAAPVCQSDADCVISCARAGECCDQLCPPCAQAFHKDALAAHETWRGPACAATSCPVARCMAPKEETVARCSSGTCVVERRPLPAAP